MERENNNYYKSFRSLRKSNKEKLELSSTGYGLVNTVDEPEKNQIDIEER